MNMSGMGTSANHHRQKSNATSGSGLSGSVNASAAGGGASAQEASRPQEPAAHGGEDHVRIRDREAARLARSEENSKTRSAVGAKSVPAPPPPTSILSVPVRVPIEAAPVQQQQQPVLVEHQQQVLERLDHSFDANGIPKLFSARAERERQAASHVPASTAAVMSHIPRISAPQMSHLPTQAQRQQPSEPRLSSFPVAPGAGSTSVPLPIPIRQHHPMQPPQNAFASLAHTA